MFKFATKNPKSKHNEYQSEKWILRNHKVFDIFIFTHSVLFVTALQADYIITSVFLGFPYLIVCVIGLPTLLMTSCLKFTFMMCYSTLARTIILPYSYYLGEKMKHYVLNQRGKTNES